ncbi:MAG: hypothetical protein Q9170_007510 [Blastenia crenularia]
MPANSILRSLGVVFALLISALFLIPWKDGSPSPLAARQALAGDDPIFNLTRNVSLPFDRHDHSSNTSSTYAHHVIGKRALDFHTAVCRGRAHYQAVLAAFDGNSKPGQEFSAADLANGWSRVDSSQGIQPQWADSIKEIGKTLKIGDKLPELNELANVDMRFNKAFKNAAGEQIQALTQFENKGQLSATELKRRTPPLSRLSDMMWTMWKLTCGEKHKNPGDLRWIARNRITNADTVGIMTEIFTRGTTKQPVRFPGLTFGMDTEEGLALLGTPNGVTVAWLLLDRTKELGKRMPVVTIFGQFPTSPGLGYRMLWDMRPT